MKIKKRFTEEEILFIKNNYKTMFYSDIAKYLNRTEPSVDSKIVHMGLCSGRRSRKGIQLFGEKNPNWKNGISKNNYHYKKIQKERYPEHISAREKIYSLIKTKKIIVPKICSICLKENLKIYAHHPDYSKPLEIIWVCKKCHNDIHNALIAQPGTARDL